MPENYYVIAALYKFVKLPDPQAVRDALYQHCREHGIMGTVLLAPEGINGTIAGSREGVDAVIGRLRANECFHDLEHKESRAEVCPFRKLKVRVKPEIVTMGRPEVSPSEKVGEYVDPRDWNRVLDDPEVTVVDTRNEYEIAIGAFPGSVNPETESFREFEAWAEENLDPDKHEKVAMYCTGGIRCEKATSMLVGKGFEQVYHLRGGILKYLEEVAEGNSRWQGDCFVFDWRVSVDHRLQRGEFTFCMNCGWPIRPAQVGSTDFQPVWSCPHCADEGD
jgi:UPF0176 protein